MDVTVEVMLPPRGAADYSQSAHSKWRVLAPVAVYYPRKVIAEIGMPRTGYVHVTDIPMPQGWALLTADEIQARLSNRLCAVWYQADGLSSREKRIWCGDSAQIALAARNALRTNRQLTVTWTQFKQAIRNRVDDRALIDSDLNGNGA